MPQNSLVAVEGESIPLCRVMGDFVLWRRNGLPAYQLASLVDDLDHDITLIVRGRDLLDSSAAQLFLALQSGNDTFTRVVFVHHPLITCKAGRKLSKSHRALSLNAMRAAGIPATEVYRLLASQLGIPPQEIIGLDDLLVLFQEINGPRLLKK